MLPPVLVLTAGLGMRLRPLSSLRAKPALPVAGVPLIVRILRWIRAAGAEDVILNLHHRPDTITRIVGDGRAHGVRVRYSWEQPLLGSGGGPRRAFSLIAGDDLLVVNGDTLTDVDLAAMWTEHHESAADVTLAVVPNPAPERYGGVAVDTSGRVTGFTRRGSAAPAWHFVGVQCVTRRAFAGATDGVPCESVAGVYPALFADRPGSVRAWITRADFDDIGTPATYLDTALAVAAREGGSTIEPGASVERGAHLVRSIAWPGARVEAGAELVECIVADGVVVRGGARYHRSALVPAGTERRPGEREVADVMVVPFEAKEAGA